MAGNYEQGPGEMEYCVPKVPYKSPANSQGPTAENEGHIEECGEREDAAGYNVYHGPATSGQRTGSGD